MQHGETGNAARCDGGCSTLQRETQHGAMEDGAQCDGRQGTYIGVIRYASLKPHQERKGKLSTPSTQAPYAPEKVIPVIAREKTLVPHAGGTNSFDSLLL